VKIGPSDAVMRRREIWGGMAAEFVQVTKHETLEFSFCAPCHRLVVYEQGERREGDTVEGLPHRHVEV
jgi:AraC family transcriptional regulator